ncbi:MAG: glycogen debranching protein [Bacteroidia bacterium]|nr:glycogen debranching protein [Bacteroidia bacterium]
MTAGDRLYAVGAQNGTFPEIGWHIDGEMGGVWNHPIKLLDGYGVTINKDGKQTVLNNAQFINYPLANKFIYELGALGLKIEQVQFVPDQFEGMVVEYIIENKSSTNFEGDFNFSVDVDLRPTWLGERSNMIDSIDQLAYHQNENVFVAKDTNNDWFCIVGSSEVSSSQNVDASKYKGQGKSGTLSFPLSIPANKDKNLSFYISGSYTSEKAASGTINDLRSSSVALFQDKMKRYTAIEEFSRLTTSDDKFNEIYRWIKYNSDWFVREVPEVGRGIAAGYPDYPWWFGCDSEYALQGYLSIGAFDLVESNIDLLTSLSKKTNENGRIIHEASTNGVVFNPGNINETPQFVSLLWNTYLWTGNEALLSSNFDIIKKGMDWIINEKDENKNGFPEGHGMMEIHGLDSEMIDVASYTQRGLEDAAKIANVLGHEAKEEEYAQLAVDLKNKINAVFWVEDFNSFGDFIANDKQTLGLIEDAIVRADTLNKPWAIEELEETKKYLLKNPSNESRPFVLHHNWVVNTPMELSIADEDKARKALETARKFVNPFGVFVTGIDRDDSAGKDIGSFKGSKIFSYTGAVMTLPTGVSAVSENNYGNPDHALDYLKRMGRSFSYALPGSIYEVSPDYGMFAQAWNIYSYAVPVVQQFFGINPNAVKKEITIKPLMPTEWEFANLDNVRIGSNEISLSYTKNENGYSLKVLSREPNWKIDVLPTQGHEIVETNSTNDLQVEYIIQEN